MKSEDLLRSVIEVEAPWQVVKVRDDLGKRQVDVWIAQQTGRSGWFFGSKATVPQDREQVWRHINLGNSRCLIHAVPPPKAAGEAPLWCGDGDLPFTRAMSRQIASMLLEGIKFQSICSILDVTVADLWKFKHSLDSGKAGLSSAPPPPPAAAAPSTRVPEADDPVWEKLLDGSTNIDIRVLSLKLLLTKLREQMRVITDAEVRVLKAYELQRYFVRYEQMLNHELGQLGR
ncbi:MAG TPA: hypothetical protein PKL28_09505 [Rhodocyclaceae bacterium]|jgi:hypothetical protein|nr:hypothetical protein [Rhodocyclaceae bacterium]HNE42602.1 hypothetical protein [Rhodocyclaceae bacterium]HNL20809.1 hypothetical protein [Rhodocyclaceae bacterium]HNM22347.1 hypothetical protein [Rhodocyclaceae bacterium]HNM81283.1 hypothetical protein [Rhodocyclaceae bacterium]